MLTKMVSITPQTNVVSQNHLQTILLYYIILLLFLLLLLLTATRPFQIMLTKMVSKNENHGLFM